MSSIPWKSKTAVVCGASAGLGRQFALELARQQISRAALVARSLDALQAVQQEMLTLAPQLQVACVVADLQDKSQLQRAVETIHGEMGEIDLVIQAVGQSDRGRLADLSDSRLQELLATNVLTSLHAVQCFVPRMRSPGGCVVLIGSLASKFAPRFLGGYAVAKHALAALAQQARLELAEQGIHVLLACPGPIARPDAGTRYDQLASDSDLPAAARQPGGGAKLKGLEPQRLVRTVLRAAAAGQPQVIRPFQAQCLVWLSALSCRAGDWLLRRRSG